MNARKHSWILTILLIIVVCANLLNVTAARADGEPPTEPPAATDVATEQPAEPPAESTPAPIEEEATPVAEALTEVPAATEVVVLDESGESIPLATQEAADISQATDPMWCPAGVLPGGAGCTTDFPTITALISNMVSSTATYTQNGVIYFTASPGTGTLTLTDGTLTGGDFNTLKGYNLTLQGGWNGSTASPSFSGQTNFGTSPITIGTSTNRWVGNVTLNDIVFGGVSSTSLTVYTSVGNITLSNVDVIDQGNGSNTALLNSTSGNIAVQNGSTFDGNNSNSLGFSATTGGSIAVSDSSFTENQRPGNNTADGATLSAPTVTLTNATATNNDGNGIVVNNANLVTLNNVLASTNGTELNPVGLTNNVGSGVFVNGNAGSRLIIIGGAFNNNQRYGVEVATPANTTIYIQSNPTCTGNDSNAAPTNNCYNDATIFDNTAPAITPNISGTAGSNGWYTSNVSLSWSVTDGQSGILSSTGCTTSNLSTNTAGSSFTCSASNNAGLTNSASVTIKIDKTAPTLSMPANITTAATGPSGAVVNYTASATDNLDPSVVANCSPATGSTFGIGPTTVNCFSTDAAGNTATGSFEVTVDNSVTATVTPPSVTSTPPATSPASTSEPSTGGAPASSASSSPSVSNSQSNSSAFAIPLTGGEVINLNCNSVFTAFSIKLSFINLCDDQTTIHKVDANNLPGKLPEGLTFVTGLDLSILNQNQVVEDLPNGSGVQMDFPISGGSKDQFVALYWNGSAWVEISQQIGSDKVSQALSQSSDNEFYLVQNAVNTLLQVLTTDKTGIFVLAKK